MTIRPIAWMKDAWGDVKNVFTRTGRTVARETSELVSRFKPNGSEANADSDGSFLSKLGESLRGHSNKPHPVYTVGKYRRGQRVRPFRWVYPDQEKVASRPEKSAPVEEQEIILRPGRPLDIGPVRPLNTGGEDSAAATPTARPELGQRLAAAYRGSDPHGFKDSDALYEILDSGRFDARA